jgi:hypothetical protein
VETDLYSPAADDSIWNPLLAAAVRRLLGLRGINSIEDFVTRENIMLGRVEARNRFLQFSCPALGVSNDRRRRGWTAAILTYIPLLPSAQPSSLKPHLRRREIPRKAFRDLRCACSPLVDGQPILLIERHTAGHSAASALSVLPSPRFLQPVVACHGHLCGRRSACSPTQADARRQRYPWHQLWSGGREHI